MANQELQAVLELLARVVFDARTGGLMLLLLVAAVCDYRTHRIPNQLVLWGTLFGVIYTATVPPFVHATVLFPISGFLVGLLLFMPLYLVRAMGAGDVKLLAMTGAFLGPLETLYAALATVIAGGFLAIMWVVARGRTIRMLQNITLFFQLGLLGALAGSTSGLRIAPETSAGKLPYGIAIAIGTIGYLFMNQLGLL